MQFTAAQVGVMMLSVLQLMPVSGQDAAVAQQRLRKNSLLVKPEEAAAMNSVALETLIKEDQDIWNRMLLDPPTSVGSMGIGSMNMGGGSDSCVPPGISEFEIDEDVNIGDTLEHPGPGFTRRCGADCYIVKDSGDDPPYDPDQGDTLRFAYRSVSSNKFSIRSRVCGVDCQRHSPEGLCGRTGLMVRESLDPFSKNIFAAHEPETQAVWWYRLTNGDYGDAPVFGADGSPDVTCLWITLERDGDQFTFSYDYEGDSECDLCQCLDLTQTVTIEMPETVLVGLGVSSGNEEFEEYRRYTTANFKDIEFQYE